jgi:hypothetical protein
VQAAAVKSSDINRAIGNISFFEFVMAASSLPLK